MRSALRFRCAVAALVIVAGCSRGSDSDQLAGKWANRHLVAKQPAIVSIEFLPKGAITLSVVDALAAAGWHPQTTSTGQYEVIAPDRLKITEDMGSAVLDYRIDGAQLVLSGDGLAQLLGKAAPPQTLDKAVP